MRSPSPAHAATARVGFGAATDHAGDFPRLGRPVAGQAAAGPALSSLPCVGCGGAAARPVRESHILYATQRCPDLYWDRTRPVPVPAGEDPNTGNATVFFWAGRGCCARFNPWRDDVKTAMDKRTCRLFTPSGRTARRTIGPPPGSPKAPGSSRSRRTPEPPWKVPLRVRPDAPGLRRIPARTSVPPWSALRAGPAMARQNSSGMGPWKISPVRHRPRTGILSRMPTVPPDISAQFQIQFHIVARSFPWLRDPETSIGPSRSFVPCPGCARLVPARETPTRCVSAVPFPEPRHILHLPGPGRCQRGPDRA
jgi:hypothetical protein